MKILIFGYGSIGQRHAANLHALRPDVSIKIVDPPMGYPISGDFADGVIIATPTDQHADILRVYTQADIPCYVEKPLDARTFQPYVDKCAVGYQYRFHPHMPAIAIEAGKTGTLRFRACDDLLARYGTNVGSVIAAHPINTALWLLGPALSVDLESDGLSLSGRIIHERGLSTHDYRINTGPRVSTVTSFEDYNLYATNQMYIDCLGAWLSWIETGRRDPRTCTLDEGLAVDDVLAKVRYAEVTR